MEWKIGSGIGHVDRVVLDQNDLGLVILEFCILIALVDMDELDGRAACRGAGGDRGVGTDVDLGHLDLGLLDTDLDLVVHGDGYRRGE